MFGRPANSASTPTLGSAQQRSQSNAYKQAQNNSRVRQIYHTLAGGVSNRLLLSLRCGIPQEVDYALELFVQYSYSDAANIPLEALPGLPSALLEIVRPTAAKDSDTVRRRTEAALVLRNFILEGGHRCIELVRPYKDLIFDVLVEVIDRDAESNTEILLYMLDMSEVYASSHTLQTPNESSSSSSPSISSPTSLHRHIDKFGSSSITTAVALREPPAARLYNLLAQLAQSNDRAIIIGAYTLLGGLAMNRLNQSAFASRQTLPHPQEDTVSPHCPTTNLVKRAVSLLPLNDTDVLLPLLEFLYQYTLIPNNASRFLQHKDIRNIVRTVATRIREGAREEIVEYEIQTAAGLGQNHRGKAMREALISAYSSLDTSQPKPAPPAIPFPIITADVPTMPTEPLQAILLLPEPERALRWMKAIYEPSEEGEITQVSLWVAYQKQFEPFDGRIRAGEVPPMLNASDLIKGTQEAFPIAAPRHVDSPNGPRFVISGMKVRIDEAERERSAKEKELWRCKWIGCELISPLDNAQELYEHLDQTHINWANPDGPTNCLFGGCGQLNKTARQLQFHLRTHIPSPVPLAPNAPPALAHAADAQDRLSSFFYERRQLPQVTHGEFAAGIGFVASLVIRNIARATAGAAQRYKRLAGMHIHAHAHHVDAETSERGKNAALDNEEDDVERRKMFGFLTGSTMEEDSAEEADAADAPREVTTTEDQLRNAINGLTGIERDLIAVTASNRALAAYLTETLECIREAKISVHNLL